MYKFSQKKFMGSLLKSIRTEKEIPIKNIALDLGISESTISQFETGKNMLSSERMKAILLVCNCEFDFSIKRTDIIKLIKDAYFDYTMLEKDNMKKRLNTILKNKLSLYSFARFDYSLAMYMNLIINQIDDKKTLTFVKLILENCCEFLDESELVIYYDIKALEEMYKINNFQALKYLKLSSAYDDSQLMVNYHFASTYLCLGYLSLSQKYIYKCINIAVQTVAFDRLCYLLLNLGVIYIYTHQFSDAQSLNDALLYESEKRNNDYLKYCVLSNISLSYLLQHNYHDGIYAIEKINEKYSTDFDIILYKAICYYQVERIDEIKNNINDWLLICRKSRYHCEFLKGLKYLINGKELKAIESIEKCYNLTIKNGEIDRGMLDLKVLEALYLKKEDKKKLEKIKQLERKMFKICFASSVLEDICLELN